MSDPYRCLLTTKDFSLLVALLERDEHRDEAFLRLLRRKLSGATVVFRDDIAPHVAMIGSQIAFTANGDHAETCTLVEAEGSHPEPALPVTTLRGLALLGLAAGETVAVQRSDGGREELRLDKVIRQPAVARREPARPASRERQASVVAFRPRSRVGQAVALACSLDPDDDDPGPRAA
jgi:regulator of nucleoside diphosphate kinase